MAFFDDGFWGRNRYIHLRCVAQKLDAIRDVRIGLLGHEFNESSTLRKSDEHHRYRLILVLLLIFRRGFRKLLFHGC